MKIRDFMRQHFRHFNAAAAVDAAEAYRAHVESGNVMLMTLAGAMSTAELGRSLAEMIRQEKVHAICCTAANLEEDVFNLVAHEHYVRIPRYRELTVEQETGLLQKGLNRVTDTCIPEEEAIRRIERIVIESWKEAEAAGRRALPHEFLYELLRAGRLDHTFQIDPRDSWVYEAAQRELPLFVPGWEDSSLGNVYAARLVQGILREPSTVRSGIEYMTELMAWYESVTHTGTAGFFQIGGGIAGDFPIAVVPTFRQDMKRDLPLWSYFCQISDSTTSYGSYSGAVPNEKITWGKLGADTASFVIESDATIVAPLIFGYVLDW